MQSLAFDARMRTTDEHGVTRRASLAASAARGNPIAIDALTPPDDYPESLEYLKDWADDLVGTSGVGMDGYAPLSWSTIDAWSRQTGIRPDAEECRALRMLDAVMRHPEILDAPSTDTTDAIDAVVPVEIPAWPQ